MIIMTIDILEEGTRTTGQNYKTPQDGVSDPHEGHLRNIKNNALATLHFFPLGWGGGAVWKKFTGSLIY